MKFWVPDRPGQALKRLSGSTPYFGEAGRGHFGEAGRGGFEGQVWGVLGHLSSQAQTQIACLRCSLLYLVITLVIFFFHNSIPHQATLLFGVCFCIW